MDTIVHMRNYRALQAWVLCFLWVSMLRGQTGENISTRTDTGGAMVKAKNGEASCEGLLSYVSFATTWEGLLNAFQGPSTGMSGSLEKIVPDKVRSLQFRPLDAREMRELDDIFKNHIKNGNPGLSLYMIVDLKSGVLDVRKARMVRTDGQVVEPVWILFPRGNTGPTTCYNREEKFGIPLCDPNIIGIRGASVPDPDSPASPKK